jgi:hypothetical protein
MTFEGLFARLFGQVLHSESLLSLWYIMLRWAESRSQSLLSSLTPSTFAWPLLTLGLAWMGALIALWLRLGWAYQATKLTGVLSCLTLGLGSVLALLTLLALSALKRQDWLLLTEVADGH